MEKYDFGKKTPNFGTHIIEYTLQYGKYIGTFTVKVGGNCGGAAMLRYFDFDTCSLSEAESVNFAYIEYDDYAVVKLKDPESGEILMLEEEYSCFNDYIVKAEIIDFEAE